MVKALIAILVLCVAVLYAPFWVQISLFLIAILFSPYKWIFLLPALLADAWYSPVRNFAPANNKTLLLVVGVLLMYTLIIRMTRIRERYGLETH